MTVYEYRQRLLDALAGYDPEECVNVANYYAELIEDAEDPADQMMRLGMPEELAQRIINENGWSRQYVPMNDAPGRSTGNAGRIIALILTFPLWITVYALILALMITVIALIIALPLGFIGGLIEGIKTMTILLPYGLEIICVAFLILGAFMLTISAVRPMFTGAGGLFGRFSRFLFGKKREEGLQDGSVPNTRGVNKAVLIIGAFVFAAGLAGTIATEHYNSENMATYAKQFGIEDIDIPVDGTYNRIFADISMGSFNVEKSADGKALLRCEGIRKEGLDVRNEGDLDIKYTHKNGNTNFSFDLESRIAQEADTKFTLYLPEKQYEGFSANIGFGKLSINGMTADGITLENSSGYIGVSDCRIKDFGVTADLGNVKITGTNAQRADIECSSGSISLTDCTIPEMQLVDDLGSIKLENITSDNIKSENHSGKTELTGCSAGTLDLSADLGNIDMKNCTLGKTTIISHSGNVEFENCTQNGIFDLTSDLGNVRIDDTALDIFTAGINSGNIKMNGTSVKGSADITIDLGNADMVLTDGTYAVKGSSEIGNTNIDENAVSGTVPVNIITDSGNINVSVN